MRRREFIGGMLAGAALASAPCAVRAADTTIRMALLPIDTDACLYYAKELGYFEEAGIDAQIQVIQAGSTVVSAIVGGSLDIGFTNPIALAQAHLRGVPVVAIGPGGVYDAAHPATAAIMVPKNSSIAKASDFSGKTMACSGLKNLGQWAPAVWIDKNGGDSSKVQFVEMPFPDMPLALSQARVDSAFPAEPFITMSSASSRVVGSAYNSIARRFTIGVWVTTTQWAQSHPDLVAKFAQVLDKTALWANAHHDESSAILVKYAKLDPAIAKTMRRVQYAPRLVPREMQPILDLATHYGALPSTVAADQLVYKA